MKKTFVFLILLTISTVANAQVPIEKLYGKVINIHKINYYIVIKIETLDRKTFTVLSRTYQKNNSFFTKKKRIKINHSYNFTLQSTTEIKVSSDKYLSIHFEGLKIGNERILNSDELPYVALNTYKKYIYE